MEEFQAGLPRLVPLARLQPLQYNVPEGMVLVVVPVVHLSCIILDVSEVSGLHTDVEDCSRHL